MTHRQVIVEHLERIRRLGDRLGAFRAVPDEEALAAADALADRKDRADLPLAGVPVAIKGNVPVAGQATRNGSAASPTGPATADHETVSRLCAAAAAAARWTAGTAVEADGLDPGRLAPRTRRHAAIGRLVVRTTPRSPAR
ncbi:amidase family protein, partial [Streptomyces sp. Ncost-T10-10d]|uniref:amidase family protein n=1 Tax=Streptomyces sp. Ncost-T10-10d TaxID=1839774 RepID=UPI00081E3E22